jgi:hypothetical protein
MNAWGERFEEVKTIDRAGYFYDRLRGYVNFRQLFMDRVWFAITGNGPLAPGPSAARWAARQNELDHAIVAETARWGDSSHQPASTRSNWLAEMNFVSGYWTSNQVRAIQRFRNVNLWPLLGPPASSRSGGYFTNSISLNITHTNAAGTIKFTLDGADPRAASGLPSLGAQNYSGSITLTNATRVRARVTDGTNWSPPIDTTFLPYQALTNFVVTEIYYNPPRAGVVDGDAFEFLELQNRGAFALDLGGIAFTAGITFTFTNGTTLAPGAFVVLVGDTTNFTMRFPGATAYGAYSGKLSNSGERLTLTDPIGGTIFDFAYDDAPPWPTSADDSGTSLQRFDFTGDAGNAMNWAAAGPTPGTPAPLFLDSDGDGLPDVWEMANGLDRNSGFGDDGASGDPDRDGLTNLQEYIVGTRPRDALSFLKIEHITFGTDNSVMLSFIATSNKTYTVQQAPSLSAVWSNLTNITARETNRAEVLIMHSTTNRFYRLVTPQQP